MSAMIQPPLPPLRRKIRKSFLALIGLFSVLGAFMVISIFLASGLTPKVIHVNYDSIAAASQMREAIHALQALALYPSKSQEASVAQFEKALQFEQGNVTEPGEREVADNIRKLWVEMKAALPGHHADFAKMNTQLDALVQVNERGMFRTAEESTALSRKVFMICLLFFLVTLILAFLLSDGLANRLAKPIKEIAEVLRGEPTLNHRLKLPAPTSLEIRILATEIGELWQRLSKFKEVNIEALTAERERLETVLTSVEDAVLVLDNEERILQVSDGMLKVLGLSAPDVLRQRWSDLSTGSDNYLKLRDRLKNQIAADNIVELSVAGTKRTYAARRRDIVTPSGQKVGSLYLLHDITEARHRERLKSEFIGVLSHELKTPLQSLGTASELLSKRASEMDEDTRMLIDTVSEDVSRIRAVANDFMQVSVVDLQSLKLKMEKVPLSQLIQEWIKPFRVLARDKGVKLEFKQEGSSTIWANVDVVKFPWAISNLLANAIRVSPEKSTVEVSISDRAGTLAQIQIRDEGPGIPASVQARMFEPYYQAPASDSGAAAGFLGLGLTIAREVVEAHEGRLEYFPRQTGGSIFMISVPFVVVYQ